MTNIKEIVENSQSQAKWGPWVAFLRIFLGIFWLYEVIIGHNWKVGHPEWVGSGAGEYVINSGLQAIEDGTWTWFAWVWTEIMIPYAPFWSYLVIGLQLAFGLLFLFGLLVRPTAVIALAFDLSVFMLGNSRIPPLFTIGHMFVLISNAGMYYGVDGVLAKKVADAKTAGAKALKYILNLDVINEKTRPFFISATLVIAMYYFLKVPMLETKKMAMVSLDLAALFGLGTYALYISKDKIDRITLAAGLTRIFIGYKFLHEIWVRDVPALNGLPGWGNGEQLGEIFAVIVEKHWSIISSTVSLVFVPYASFWAIAFAVIQTVIAIMLIVGWKTNVASKVALFFVGGLILIGFARYAPFIFGYLVIINKLDAGRFIGFDAGKVKEGRSANMSNQVIAILLGIAIAAWIAALVSGIDPDGYKETMGASVSSFIGIFAGIFAVTGIIQKKLTSNNIESDEKKAA